MSRISNCDNDDYHDNHGAIQGGGKSDHSSSTLEQLYPMSPLVLETIFELLNKPGKNKLEQLTAEAMQYLGREAETPAQIEQEHASWSSLTASAIATAKSLLGGIRSLNFGQRTKKSTRVLMVKHYAPATCRTRNMTAGRALPTWA